MKPKKPIQEVAQKEHGGACPTCGHCKCCEKKASNIQYWPICTRPHADTWPYQPYKVWYGTGLGSIGGGLTSGGGLGSATGTGHLTQTSGYIQEVKAGD